MREKKHPKLRASQASCSFLCHVILLLVKSNVGFDAQPSAVIPTSQGHHTTCCDLLIPPKSQPGLETS